MSDINYPDIAGKLFPRDPEQKLVPFLGAGASLGVPQPVPDQKSLPGFPDEGGLNQVFSALNLTGPDNERNRCFVIFGLALAYLMSVSGVQLANVTRTVDEEQEELAKETYPPSVGKLIDFLALASNHSGFHESAKNLGTQWPWTSEKLKDQQLLELIKGLSQITGLWSDSLTSLAAYYEADSGRKSLWERLGKIFAGKKFPTVTHDLIARAARQHLPAKGETLYDDVPDRHYLIVTTNYDELMETALEKLNVPYVVLSRRKDQIYPRFAISDPETLKKLNKRNRPGDPENFDLECDDPMAIVYKIHGSFTDPDNVVISDFDYEDYIAQMAAKTDLLPCIAKRLMDRKGFLFLGYGLGDWNIRTSLTALIKRRDVNQYQDYAVMERVSKSAEAYCKIRKITILPTSLNSFAEEIEKNRPPQAFGAGV